AADATRAVGDDLLVFDVVVLIALKLGDKITRGFGVRHDRIFELAKAGLVLVAPIKKDHFVAVGLDQFVDLLRCDMFATADHAVFIDLELVLTVAEADQLAAMPYAQAREIFALAVAPLELGVL